MLKVYLAIIRPILEYTVLVWRAITEYLSQKIESIQKRALKIIKPGEESYEELLRLFNVEKLQSRREKLCKQYMGKIKSPNHQLNTLIPQQEDREHEYNLRNDNNRNFYLLIIDPIVEQSYAVTSLLLNIINIHRLFLSDILNISCMMLIIVNIIVTNFDLDSVIQCLYLINNLQKSLINLYYI